MIDKIYGNIKSFEILKKQKTVKYFKNLLQNTEAKLLKLNQKREIKYLKYLLKISEKELFNLRFRWVEEEEK